jgi:hypothetical protein
MSESATKHNAGRFQVGNPGGPGNPHARQVAVIRSALLAALTPDVLQKMIDRLIEHAVEGNMAAIKLVLAYSIGRPGKAEDALAQLGALAAEGDICVTQTPPLPETPLPHRHQTHSREPAAPETTSRPPAPPAPPAPTAPTAPREPMTHRHQTKHAARVLQAALAGGDRQQTVADKLDRDLELLGLIKDVLDPAPTASARDVVLVS